MDSEVKKAFSTIEDYAHMWNWLPDIDVACKIYEQFPNSFSVLTPFMYAYMEEVIRSTTSEYGIVFLKNGKPSGRKTGISLIKLAIKENPEKEDYIAILNDVKNYFKGSNEHDKGDNRNSTLHGYMHAGYWTKDSFETLVKDIARLSPYAGF